MGSGSGDPYDAMRRNIKMENDQPSDPETDDCLHTHCPVSKRWRARRFPQILLPIQALCLRGVSTAEDLPVGMDWRKLLDQDISPSLATLKVPGRESK